jgi:dynactin-6
VSADARLEGGINLGDGCVLHPRCAVMVSPGASLTFGPGCVVEENAIVRFVGPGHAVLGEHNVFMVGSFVDIIHAEKENSIGAWNTFSPRCRVEGVRVGDQCTFGAGTVVTPHHHYLVEIANKPRPRDADGDTLMAPPAPVAKVPSRTVVYGASSAARKWDGSGEAMEKNVRVSATEFLREVLPK